MFLLSLVILALVWIVVCQSRKIILSPLVVWRPIRQLRLQFRLLQLQFESQLQLQLKHKLQLHPVQLQLKIQVMTVF